MKKALIGVVAVIALGVLGFFAGRYWRQARPGDAVVSLPQESGPKPAVRFVKNPVTVPNLTLKTIDGRTLSSRDWKGKVSPALYLVGILLSFVHPWIGNAVYVLVALIWLVPDRRIERALQKQNE